MKNRPATTSRYYVQVWAQREASRISMKCYGTFNISNTLKNTKVPSQGKVKEWFNSQKENIRHDFGDLVEDEELVQAIDQYGKTFPIYPYRMYRLNYLPTRFVFTRQHDSSFMSSSVLFINK
jgi:hypothetical protein